MEKEEETLPGDYIAGFVDGEGCFYLMYRKETKYKRKGKPSYYRWIPYFAISVRKDDIDILHKIKNELHCGKIYILKRKGIPQAWYGIQNIDNVFNKVIPFFRQYPLRAKKKEDFELWVKAVKIIHRHKHLQKAYTEAENKLLIKLRNQMREFKSEMKRDYKHIPLFI